MFASPPPLKTVAWHESFCCVWELVVHGDHGPDCLSTAGTNIFAGAPQATG